MEVKLAYGKQGLKVNLPDRNVMGLVHMNPVPPLPDAEKAIRAALQYPIGSAPLSEIAQGRKSAVIVISDITRPVPNTLLLPPILETIEKAGIPREEITILIATGIHRPNLAQETVDLVGLDIATDYRIRNHLSEWYDNHTCIGNVCGDIPVHIDNHYLEADLKILTGLVELHLMAGFSGGRKSILPGIVSLETMKYMHGYRMIQQESVCTGKLKGNAFHEAAVDVARRVGVDFICNVTLDEQRQITGVFAGDLEAAHEKACDLVANTALVEIEQEADIVVTCGGGYPLDKTMYQTLKGFVGALQAVKPGGTVIIAAENEEGGGSEDFVNLLRRLKDPMDFYKLTMEPDYVAKDQWMIQELVNGLHHCELLYYTKGISETDLRDFLVHPISSVEEGIGRALARHGDDARILVIPEGPYVMPKVKGKERPLYSWQTAETVG